MEEAFSQVHHFALWPQEQKAAKSLVVYHSFYAADSELLDDKNKYNSDLTEGKDQNISCYI